VDARTQSRPLYAVFLEQVIQIEAVQRERAAVTEEHTADFFRLGRIPGEIRRFLWSLQTPKPVIAGIQPPPMSPTMQRAWGAAVVAWRTFIGRLISGELIANGVHPASGIRSDLDPAEWIRSAAVLDVRDGDLFTKERDGQLIPRWTSITLRPAEPVRAAIQQLKLGAIDWDAEWNEDVARRKKDQLPNEKAYVRELETRIKGRYGVTSVDGGDLRRFKAALYRGDPVRPRKR
jgi:hypothetical protein